MEIHGEENAKLRRQSKATSGENIRIRAIPKKIVISNRQQRE